MNGGETWATVDLPAFLVQPDCSQPALQRAAHIDIEVIANHYSRSGGQVQSFQRCPKVGRVWLLDAQLPVAEDVIDHGLQPDPV
jgi:hypothetical protein